jgi:hypothetical protein
MYVIFDALVLSENRRALESENDAFLEFRIEYQIACISSIRT